MFTFIPLAIFLFCLVVEILAWMPNLIAILTIIGFIVWVVVKFFGRPLVNMFGEYQAYRESKGDDSATQ
jgi:flagellar biogenesis protein FliO